MKDDLHLRIPKDLKDSLINMAENDSRSLSNLVKLILTDAANTYMLSKQERHEEWLRSQ